MKRRHYRSFASLVMAVVLVVTALSASAFAESPKVKAPKAANPKTKIQAYAEDMQPGWNLGNTLDATGSDETSWGNPRVTKELIQQIAAQGYKSIRIPVTWDQHIGPAPEYKVDSAYMDRVEEVVNWALDAKLYVMINVHHDSWVWVSYMEKKHDEVLTRYQAVWTQITDRFKNHSSKLMFEPINEPRFTDGGTTDRAKQYAMLEELITSFHQIVRSSGGKNIDRPLVIPTRETSPAQEDLNELYKTIVKLNDPNLIATVHYYGYWPFSVNIAGHYTLKQEALDDMTTTFGNVQKTLIAKGIPVIVGEYGLLGFDKHTGVIEQGEKLKFFELITHQFKENNITSMLWDNGQHFNRTAYKWNDEELYNIMKAGWKNGRASTAETDLIHLKKGTAVQDTSVRLNLNGNKMTGLFAGNEWLLPKEEYVLAGDLLTIKAAPLAKLIASGQLGQNGVITVKFNHGPDWRFKIIAYERPVFSNATGTTEKFAIPVDFKGNQLATMEATYANGENAGPQNWTSFKEFGYAFSPSYDTKEIQLTPNFFKEVKDGDIQLKLHFWSGEIVSYKITKSGTSVTGQALAK